MQISGRIESWPIEGNFTISRGTKREARVVVVEITDGSAVGRGECTPYPRYGETPEATLDEIFAYARKLDGAPIECQRLQREMQPSAARNAIDCALWDLKAKSSGRPAWALAGLQPPEPILTCYTISLGEPEAMAAKAASVRHLPLLKLKLGGAGDAAIDAARMRLVRKARPDARLVADANEGWAEVDLPALLGVAAEQGLECVEQPLPSDRDGRLAEIERPLPVCADESAHTAAELAALCDRYDAVNIKLDKTGGLTHALDMAETARSLSLDIMVGCMVATSLSMAPALLVAANARWADLDGPLLLARDRVPGLAIDEGLISPAQSALWG